MNTLQTLIFRRCNTRGAGSCIAAFLVVSGVIMVFAGIRGEGSINLKTPFANGEAKSGFVGILLIFLGAIIVLAQQFPRNRSKHKVTIKGGGRTVDWEGTPTTIEEMETLQRIISSLLEGHEPPPPLKVAEDKRSDSSSDAILPVR